ncbi:MAG: thiamine-phosphate kinase [Alphaproteobacteria bacterium]|nr:thiamine-phosphate kinase [Alphaproteobacteria bacterium]
MRRPVPEGEFDLIRRLFAPLAAGEPGAFGLADDAAVLLDTDFVVTKDLLVGGVHFPKGEPPGRAAKKALRANLSDLAAKGAKPFGYFLGCVWPKGTTAGDIEALAAGLAEDQGAFRLSLLGGDTTLHVDKGGPLTISVTMLGLAPRDGLIRRNGARAGDDVYVSGTIGDAGLGLRAASEAKFLRGTDARAQLLDRYRAPTPRLSLGGALAGVAGAAIDVSDGLVADAGHLASASGVAIDLDAARIPLSAAAAEWRDGEGDPAAAIAYLASAGDDYEILFTAPATRRRSVEMAGQVTKTQITRIGAVRSGAGVRLIGPSGAVIAVERSGYDHFSE